MYPNPSASDTVQFLQELIRCNTVNPPGNEDIAAAYIKRLFDEAGIESRIIEPLPRRASIWARIPGNGQQRPIMLLSHLDVVPVEREKWSADPFQAEIRDGYIYGRGTVDMKHMTAMELAIMLHIAKLRRDEGLVLTRDIIFLAVADEEMGGVHGMQWIVEHAPELVDVEFSVNEGGGTGLLIGGIRVFTCETAQKGNAHITLRAIGQPGHGSVPHQDNAIAHLARAIAKVTAQPLPMHLTATTKQFIDGLALLQPPEQQDQFRLIANPAMSAAVLQHVPDQNFANILRSMLHNTASPTMLNAGIAHNVIPGEATAYLDCRLIPGQDGESMRHELQDRIQDEHVIVEVGGVSIGSEYETQTPFFDALKSATQKYEPSALVVPYLFPAMSDSRFLGPLGVTAYGYIPYREEHSVPPLQMLAHGHDERISLANVEFGVNVLFDALMQMCQ